MPKHPILILVLGLAVALATATTAEARWPWESRTNPGATVAIPGQPFALAVLGEDGWPVPLTSEGYVPLAHKEHYTLRLINNASVRGAVDITMDGTSWGTRIVVDPHSYADIETIPDTEKRLTFFAKGTKEANAALLGSVSASDLGVISAAFALEEPPKKHWPGSNESRAQTSEKPGEQEIPTLSGTPAPYGAGGTGLSGHSDQTFEDTAFDDDPSQPVVTLNLRLVERRPTPRPLYPDAHPIPGREPVANPVPPPV